MKSDDMGHRVNTSEDPPNTPQNPTSALIGVMQAKYSNPFTEGTVPASDNQKPGITWTGTMTEPTEFEGTPRGAQPNVTVKGQWCFVQLIRCKRRIKDDNNDFRYWGYNSPGTYIPNPQNPGSFLPEDLTKVFILDVAFPYGKLIPDSNFIWQVGIDPMTMTAEHNNQDSPFMWLFEKYADPITHIRAELRQAEMYDTFELYQMYKPPVDLYNSTASQWVPITKLTWHTGATATLGDITANRWHLVPSSIVMEDRIENWWIHPLWQNRFDETSAQNGF